MPMIEQPNETAVLADALRISILSDAKKEAAEALPEESAALTRKLALLREMAGVQRCS